MKKMLILCCSFFGMLSCNTPTIEKPKNLIEKDKMVDILYDIALLEAIKSQNIDGGLTSKAGNDYVYKKHKIDSLQFVQSNKYYAVNIEEYKKMFEEVKERLTQETQKIEGTNNKSNQTYPSNTVSPANQDVPQVQ